MASRNSSQLQQLERLAAIPYTRSGVTYRVDGILHEYLGLASVSDGDTPVHVFMRREWRPLTSGQMPFTVISEKEISKSVTRNTSRQPPEQLAPVPSLLQGWA
ncbi:MAG TPA: hypothetical protein VIW94_05740 [Acidimicrobiia bacterium]